MASSSRDPRVSEAIRQLHQARDLTLSASRYLLIHGKVKREAREAEKLAEELNRFAKRLWSI